MSDELEVFKAKYPELNWEEAEEIPHEDIEAAAEFFDQLLEAIKKGEKDGTDFPTSES